MDRTTGARDATTVLAVAHFARLVVVALLAVVAAVVPVEGGHAEEPPVVTEVEAGPTVPETTVPETTVPADPAPSDPAPSDPVPVDSMPADSTPLDMPALVAMSGTEYAAPANDAVADAIDLSLLEIPPFTGMEGGLPISTVTVPGTNGGATVEAGENSDAGSASVWYRYTSPPWGFAGRLGVAISSEHRVDVFSARCGSTVTFIDQCPALGSTDSRSGRYVRMQPGFTVWFRIDSQPGFEPGGPFVLSLFQAPNPSDDIRFADDPIGPFGDFVQWWPTSYPLDGDTYHLTGDNGGRPNRWVTFVLSATGDVGVTIRTGDASVVSGGDATGRVLVRLYRAPSGARVSDPAVLGAQLADGEVDFGEDGTPRGMTTLSAPGLLPGRYYLEISEGEEGPQFHTGVLSLPPGSGGDVEPPTVQIVSPVDGAVYDSADGVPESVGATCTDSSSGSLTPEITVDGDTTSRLVTTIGSHVVRVSCTDSAGNTAVATATYEVLPPRVDPRIAIAGPEGQVGAGDEVYVTVTLRHPGGGEPAVPAGFAFEVRAGFTARLTGQRDLPPTVSCSGSSFEVRCVSTAELSPGASVVTRFAVRTPAIGPHSPCEEVDENGFGQRRTDVTGPVCLNVFADVPGVTGAMVSVPLNGGFLRFGGTTAVDDGAHVTLTVRPRNAGNRPITGLGFRVAPFSGFSGPMVLDSTTAPAGWTCRPDPFGRDLPSCTNPTATLASGEVGPAVVLRFASPTGRPPRCPAVTTPLPSPAPTPCGGFTLYWASADAGTFTIAGYSLFRIGGPENPPPPPSGPCVLVETDTVDFGDVTVGAARQAPVTIRSCSDAPIDVAVAVSEATTAGSTDTWIASTSTTPTGGAFAWTVTPPGGSESSPVAGTPTHIGSLAASASRTDTHRIHLGPTGPGLGRPFAATITYTALAHDP